MAIPEKLDGIKATKLNIRNVLNTTNQNTAVPFRQYPNLISNIPNSGAISAEDVDRLTRLAINISGEEA